MDRQRLSKTMAGGPGRARAEQRRLIAYGAVAVLILGFYFVNKSKPTTPPEATLPSTVLEEPKTSPPLANIEPERLAAVADTTPAQRAEIERDAAAHLIDEASLLVYGDLEKLGLQPADWSVLAAESAAHRGAAVYVLGELKWMEPVFDNRGYTVRGEVVDEQGRSWNFLVVTEPFEVNVGDIVKVAGFYLKQHDQLRPDRSWSSGPLLIGEELLRSSFRIDPVTELRPDLFLRVRDYDLTEASRPIESPEFYEVLSYVANTPIEALFPPEAPPVEYRASELMRSTDKHRGQPLRVSGLLAAVREVPLGPRGENPLGVPFVWHLWLSSYSGASLVITFEKPEGLVPQVDIVDADGIYYRRFAYENQLGQPYTAAVLVARRLQKYVPPESMITPVLMQITVGIVAVLVLLSWLVSRRDRKDAAVERSRRMVRLKKLTGMPGALTARRKSSGTAPTGPDAASQPSPPGDAPGGVGPAPPGA